MILDRTRSRRIIHHFGDYAEEYSQSSTNRDNTVLDSIGHTFIRGQPKLDADHTDRSCVSKRSCELSNANKLAQSHFCNSLFSETIEIQSPENLFY